MSHYKVDFRGIATSGVTELDSAVIRRENVIIIIDSDYYGFWCVKGRLSCPLSVYRYIASTTDGPGIIAKSDQGS